MMNNKLKVVLLAGGFVLLLVVATLGYNALKENASPNADVFTPKPTNTTPAPEASVPTPEASVPTPNASAAPSPTPEASNDAEESEYQMAPDFTMLDFDGNEVKLSDFFGKPIVMNFFATWCPSCRADMPGFDNVYQDFGDDITFIMLDLTDGARETVEIGRKYIEEQGYTFPVYFDHMQEANYAYGIQAIPLTLLIDAQGYIVAGANQSIDEETLRAGIALLQE